MQAATYNNTLINSSLTVVTTTSTVKEGATSLTVDSGNKIVAKSGEKVFLYTKFSNDLYLLTLTADLGTSTTCSFSATDFQDFIPEGSVVLMPQEGMFDKVNNTDLYFHQSICSVDATTNDFLSAYGSNAFTVDAGLILTDGATRRNLFSAHYSCFVAPYACTLKKIKGWANSNAGASEGAVITVWTATPNSNSSSDLTIDLVHAFTLTSQNDSTYVFDLEQDTSALADAQLAEGDIIFVSIRRTGSRLGRANWYAQIGFDAEMFKQPI